MLPIGVSRVNITLTILADQIPELEEAFTLRLTEAQGGATLDAARSVSTFSVRCVKPTLPITTLQYWCLIYVY